MVAKNRQTTMVRFQGSGLLMLLASHLSCRMLGVQLARHAGARASSTLRAVARTSCEVKSEVSIVTSRFCVWTRAK
jgi:hypothetical protein